jgi:hypothetical protein
MEWVVIIIIIIVVIVFVKTPKENWKKFPQNEKVTFKSIERKEQEYKDDLFRHYLELNKDLTYQEIDAKIERGRKDNYEDYTEESKMEFRALKTLQQRIRTEDFRNFFIEKGFIDENISSQELNNRIHEIRFYIDAYKMKPIPEDIVNEAKEMALKKEFEEYKNLLTSKSILQVKNWMEKRKDKTLPFKIQEYYKYRLDFEVEEYRLTKEITKLRGNINRNASVGNLDKVKEYEALLEEIFRKLEHLKNSFFDDLRN